MILLSFKKKSHFIFHARIDTAVCTPIYVYIILYNPMIITVLCADELCVVNY